MVTFFELLPEGVRVTEDEKIGGMDVGTASYLVSYKDFKEHLIQVKESSVKKTNGNYTEFEEVNKAWGDHNTLRLPINSVEVELKKDGSLGVKQLVGGGGYPFFSYPGEEGRQVDTSRFLIEFEVTQEKKIKKGSVSTFKGLMYGKHTPEQLVHNELLTRKLQTEFVGNTYREVRGMDAGEVLLQLNEEDIKRAKGNTLQKEIERVLVEGGAIRWEEITC